MGTSNKSRSLLESITPKQLTVGMAVFGLTVIVGGTCLLYSSPAKLPPPGDPPPETEYATIDSPRFQKQIYVSRVKKIMTQLGLSKLTIADIKKGNLRNTEFFGEYQLKIGKEFETPSLLIKASSRKLLVGQEGNNYRAKHLTLEITNKTDKFLAYRVRTTISGDCRGQGFLPFNALALKPHERIERSECLLNKTYDLAIKQVEVMELTSLGYHYVSRLDPLRMQFDRRTSEGHQTSILPTCKMLPWRVFAQEFNAKKLEWYDVIDFYSRHDCDHYAFYAGYKWAKSGPTQLPAALDKSQK
ncbi:MAG: hypothetical protein V1754_13535 [Pseudomonadota bacterium]